MGVYGTLYDYTLNVAKPVTDAVDVNIWLNQQAMMNGYCGRLEHHNRHPDYRSLPACTTDSTPRSYPA